MSFSLNKLRSLLPGSTSTTISENVNKRQRHSVNLEPEIGFQISIESNAQTAYSFADGDESGASTRMMPELNVHLIAARHLPALFGFKVVQGYNIKVKLFPGSKRLDSSIQTNSWPKFNENFKFALAPDIKPSIKNYANGKTISEYVPEELFAGQFVVFTVYALLELPPASFNRFNKTYRSLRDKSTSFMHKVVEGSTSIVKNDTANNTSDDSVIDKPNRKLSSGALSGQEDMPQLTPSEARRNIGSVTCYLEPKIFRRNTRNGQYSTEEIWLPIKDINTTLKKGANNTNVMNSTKGLVELILEVQNINASSQSTVINNVIDVSPEASPTKVSSNSIEIVKRSQDLTSEMKRRSSKSKSSDLVLRVTTSKMRCSNKVKDELEASAGSIYVKTTIFEHKIYTDSWKSGTFYPSLSTKWDSESASVRIPIRSMDSMNDISIKTTLATKSKIGKKLVLGTVLIGPTMSASGFDHWQKVYSSPQNERIAMWHCFK